MKKSLTMLALAFGVSGMYAQDLTSKKGEQILPEAGDWAIGIDASPFLNYMGNFFGKSANNSAPTFSFLTTNQTITGKYFVDAQTAYRASLRIGFGSQTQRTNVADRSSVPTGSTYPSPDPVKENDWKHSNTNIGLAVGIEKRKGKTRLQGYYGAEVGINFSSSRDKFTYGNALNPNPAAGSPAVLVDASDAFSGANNLSSGAVVTGQTPATSARVTDRKNGSVFAIGARAFIGVEYFILPKISLGGEFGWGLGVALNGKSSTTYESTGNNGTANETGTTKIDQPHHGGLALDTDNTNSIFGASAAIRLNFHF